MSYLGPTNISSLTAPLATIGTLSVSNLVGYTPSGGTANLSNISNLTVLNTLTTAQVSAQTATVSVLNYGAASGQNLTLTNNASINSLYAGNTITSNLVSNNASISVLSVGNVVAGNLVYVAGQGQTLTISNTANLAVLVANTSTLGNVQGPLTVAGDIIFTGNLRQTLFANSAAGGLLNYTFGNIIASNAAVTGTLTALAANITTLNVSNLVGYTAGAANLSNISNLVVLSVLTANAANVTGNLTSNNVTVSTGLSINTTAPLYPFDMVGIARHTGNVIVNTGSLNVANYNPIVLGFDQIKETNAGKIGYGSFSSGNCVDIVGAGTVAGQRKVQLFDQFGVQCIPAYYLDVNGNVRLQTAAGIGCPPAANAGSLTVGGVYWANNQVQNQMLCLYTSDSVPSSVSTNFYGLGMGSSQMRYQVPSISGSQHTWYYGTNSIASITNNGLVMANNITVGGPLSFNNQINNQMICLFNNNSEVANSTNINYFGFGINAGTLRYQVPASTVHNFYIGNTSVCNISAANIQTILPIQVTSSNAGDMISKQYASIGDRYGMGVYNNGTYCTTRVFASSQFSNANIALSLASTDTTGGAGTFQDIVSASNAAVMINRALVNGASTRATYSVSVASTVGAFTQICNMTNVSGAFNVYITLVQSHAYNSITKTYSVPIAYTSATGSSWFRCQASTSTGLYQGNDFALDVSTNSNTAFFRVVRTVVGTSTNTSLTAFVDVTSDTYDPVALAYDGTTGTSATYGNIYGGTPLTSLSGNVGILTTTPAYPLDVNGIGRFQGQLIQQYPLSFFYKQTAVSSSTSGSGWIPTSKSMFTFSSTASMNTTATLFASDATNTSISATNAVMSMPYSGIWSITWSVRFNASQSENDAALSPMVSAAYGETSANSNGTRLGWVSTSAYNLSAPFTGYFASGDTVSLSSYTSGSNYLNNNYGAFLSVVLVQRSA